MQLTYTGTRLFGILEINLEKDTLQWLNAKMESILSGPSARELYLTYSLLSGRVQATPEVAYPNPDEAIENFLKTREANLLQIARIWLLSRVLEADPGFFRPKVAQLIELADTGELQTFLRYLILLPEAGEFRKVAVEALRTNIATVFDAITLDNPYPAEYFNEQQWNQMYLKAAFMQRELGRIHQVEARANKDLARIISDYAHERWAASREVDPMFWRPVAPFIEGVLLEDMKRMLERGSLQEKRAAALCCHHSGKEEAKNLLKPYPDLAKEVASGSFNWNNLKM